MKKLSIALASLWLLFAPLGADAQTINNLGAGRGSVIGADLFPSYQGALPAVRPSATQIATFVYGLMSGDCTASVSVITCAKINGNTFPASGTSGGIPYFSGANALSSSAALTANLPVIGGGAGVAPSVGSRSGNTTQFVTTTGTQTSGDCVKIDASGNHVANGSACGTATPANPTATAGPTAVNGAAGTFMRSDAAPAIQLGTAAQKGIVQVDGTTIVATAGVISAGGVAANLQTGANYPIVAGDFGKLVLLSNASNQTPTLPTAATVGANWVTNVCNINAGVQTITPTTSTIGGAANYPLRAGSALSPTCITIQSDGTNYNLVSVGSTVRVASGTATLGTAAIGSAACASVVTVAAAGVATTDVVSASFNGDPTAVTGYVPLTSGMLTIIGYPTSGNVNFKVCNNTAGSITPGAITLNFRVDR